jgi:hypothetical protein
MTPRIASITSVNGSQSLIARIQSCINDRDTDAVDMNAIGRPRIDSVPVACSLRVNRAARNLDEVADADRGSKAA